jgi:hypothetical protein
MAAMSPTTVVFHRIACTPKKAQSRPREIGNATGYIGNPGHADQENLNACTEGSDQRKMAVRVEFFENDANDG